MMAKRKAESWTGDGMVSRTPDKQPAHTASSRAERRQAGGRGHWRDRESRLVEALLDFTTIAGLFALLFALLVLFGAAQILVP